MMEWRMIVHSLDKQFCSLYNRSYRSIVDNRPDSDANYKSITAACQAIRKSDFMPVARLANGDRLLLVQEVMPA
jgi:hypothetical protein